MGFLDFFRPLRKTTIQRWQEFGQYTAFFSAFSGDIYNNAVVRSCIRPLAEFTSKASAICSDKQLERLLNNRPNVYMNGKAFLQKVRTLTELNNTCFIYIDRDDRLKVKGVYPVPYTSFEALEYMNGLFIRFQFPNTQIPQMVLPWDDLAVVRKDYNKSDIAGDDNRAIIDTIKLLTTVDEGMANAIRSTANLRGILKTTKGMLAPEDIKAQKEKFVEDYMNLDNEGGIASLDASQEFTPITMNPLTASYEQLKEVRENIYRYFGVNEKIVTSDMTPEEIEAFYELKIEPFLVQLSTEMTSKVFQGKALAYEQNFIVFEASKLQFASLSQKISMFKEVVLYGGMTINEWRVGCNMAPVPWGDDPIMRLDAAPTDTQNTNEEDDDDKQGSGIPDNDDSAVS